MPCWFCSEDARIARRLNTLRPPAYTSPAANRPPRWKPFRPLLPPFRNDAFYQRHLGLAYLRLGRYAEATASLERALELEPHYADVYRDMAAVFEAQEMKQAAIAWLERGTRQVPGYEPLFRDLVDLQLLEDRPDEALSILEAAVLNAGRMRCGRISVWRTFTTSSSCSRRPGPPSPPSWRSSPALRKRMRFLATCSMRQEKYEDAADAYRRAIVLDPDDHSSHNNLAWLYAIQGIRLKEALRLSWRSLQKVPDSPTYLDTLAEIYYRSARYERAIDVIRHAISLQPEDPALRDHLQSQLDKFMSAFGGRVDRSGAKGTEDLLRAEHSKQPTFQGG